MSRISGSGFHHSLGPHTYSKPSFQAFSLSTVIRLINFMLRISTVVNAHCWKLALNIENHTREKHAKLRLRLDLSTMIVLF